MKFAVRFDLLFEYRHNTIARSRHAENSMFEFRSFKICKIGKQITKTGKK